MTALNDLADVNAPSPSDDDVLTYDDATSMWIAQAPPPAGSTAEWQHNEGTLTYPSGDNLWTYVEDHTSSPVQSRHIENTTSVPANDDALVDTITVTSGMVDVGGTSGLLYPVTVGLKVSVSVVPHNRTGNFTWRVALQRNGVTTAYQSMSVFTSRDRASQALTTPVAAGDTIKVHSWLTSDANAEGVDVTMFAAAPCVYGFNVPTSADDGQILMMAVPAPGFQQTTSGPDGTDAVLYGPNAPGTRWRYQTNPTAGDTSNIFIALAFSGLYLPHGTTGSPYYGEAIGNGVASESGPPLLGKVHQYTSYDFWTLMLDWPYDP